MMWNWKQGIVGGLALAAAAAFVVTVTSTSARADHRHALDGVALGGFIGGAIGSTIGKGTGRAAAIGAGALLGSLYGHYLTEAKTALRGHISVQLIGTTGGMGTALITTSGSSLATGAITATTADIITDGGSRTSTPPPPHCCLPNRWSSTNAPWWFANNPSLSTNARRINDRNPQFRAIT